MAKKLKYQRDNDIIIRLSRERIIGFWCLTAKVFQSCAPTHTLRACTRVHLNSHGRRNLAHRSVGAIITPDAKITAGYISLRRTYDAESPSLACSITAIHQTLKWLMLFPIAACYIRKFSHARWSKIVTLFLCANYLHYKCHTAHYEFVRHLFQT